MRLSDPIQSQPNNYLPEILDKEFWRLFGDCRWETIQERLKQLPVNYERLGFDRLLTILVDLRLTFGRWSDYRILDVGCNTGAFSLGLSSLGNRVTGIDTNAKLQDISKRLLQDHQLEGALQRKKPEFHCVDIRDFFANKITERWDVILLLSVVHHWQNDLAQPLFPKFSDSEFDQILNQLITSFNYAIYYECPLDEAGFAPGRNYFDRYSKQGVTLSEVCFTTGPQGHRRQLFRIERT